VSDSTQKKAVHVYDDIVEEDNHLPNWWLFILYATILFSFAYWLVYHTTKTLPQPGEAYRAQIEALNKARASANPMSPEALVALSKDPAVLAEGQQVFATTCAACHGQQGEGLIGPNLTDGFTIHGVAPQAVLDSVMNGYPDKGMPPWGQLLGPDKTRKVAAYVLTLPGKNVAGKAPQGQPIG